MIKLNGRQIDPYGQVIFDEDGLCKVLMSGESLTGLIAESNHRIEKFNELYQEWDNGDAAVIIYSVPSESVDEYHKNRQQSWFMDDKYSNLDVKEWLLERCSTVEQRERVIFEYDLFAKKSMISILAFLIFLVDYSRSRNLVWGVGRGSSVASYCLYLIGIHRIDSFKYNLDFQEFLK